MTDDLADLAARQLNAVFIDNPHVVAVEWHTHGGKLVRVGVGRQHAGATTFGHAVELDQAARPALENVGLELGMEGGAGAELHDVAVQVIAVEVRAGHDALILNRYQHGVGDAVLFGQFQVALGVKLGHQYNGAAQTDARQEGDQGSVGVQRGGDQGAAVRTIAERQAALDVRPAHAMGLHDALRLAGGAGGVYDVESHLRCDLYRGRYRPRFCQPVAVVRFTAAVVHADQRHAEAIPDAGHGALDAGIGEIQFRGGVGEHAQQAFRGG